MENIEIDHNWLVRETEFKQSMLHVNESVFTIGNGYLSTRGTFEGAFRGRQPVTFIHGVFDDAPVVVTELANVPDWLPVVIYLNGERVGLDTGEILSYERVLNLRNGVLTRSYRWRNPQGHILDVRYERFASLADLHVVALRCQVTPINCSGQIELQAVLNGNVDNAGFQHWNKVEQGHLDEQTIYLQSITRRTGIMLCEAARLMVEGVSPVEHTVLEHENAPTLVARFYAEAGQTVTADKLVTIYTSRDVGWHTRQAALSKLSEVCQRERPYEWLKEAQAQFWAEYWDRSDIEIDGDDEAQRAIRYSIFQLLIAGPRWDEYVSIGAKTLSGYGYRGHVFWDTEIFILPMFIYTQPHIARNLLMYRYHTLGGARRKAREAGHEGAQYPWEAAMLGDEVAPRWLPSPSGLEVRVWTGDIELHISADIAYAVWQYWRVTGDDDFMARYGAEMILDTAIFWSSRVEWHAETGRYELHDVIGPDEYHEHVNNNTFTNYLVKWHLQRALEIMDWLLQHHPDKAAELTERLEMAPGYRQRWQDIIDKIYILYDPATRLFEQFEGYFQRRDVDLSTLEPRDRSVQALLGLHGTNETQILKQPDVLMLMYMLPEEFDDATVRANWDYYTPRTDLTYGSSLAPGIQAVLACRLGDPDAAYPYFMQAALIDLKDLRLNTAYGIHGAAAGAAWQAVVFGFGGVRVTNEGLVVQPRLPSHWQRLKFRIYYRGERREFEFHQSGRVVA